MGTWRGLGLLEHKIQGGGRVGTPLGDVAREVARARLFMHALSRSSSEQQKAPGAVLGFGFNSEQAAELSVWSKEMGKK